MAVTIKDVSAKCGLSISTVSKAFNNYADISLETRELVKRTARGIGYYNHGADTQLLRLRPGCIQVGGGEARERHHLHQPPHRVDGHDLSGALPIPQCGRRVRRLR